MSTRNNILGLIFLAAVLAFAVFATKRLLFSPPRPGSIAALLEKSKPAPKPLPKPSAAVTAPSSPAPSSPAPSSAAPSLAVQLSNGKEQVPAPATGAVASPKKEPSPAAGAAIPTEDHRPQLRLEAGVRLWIRVTAITRKPDGSFSFRGTLLQPVTLAEANQLDQGTDVSGSGTVNNGHVTVLLTAFTVSGANYALRQDDASGSNKRPGTGLAVELDPGKLLEVWLASSSVYRKTP